MRAADYSSELRGPTKETVDEAAPRKDDSLNDNFFNAEVIHEAQARRR